MKRLTENTVFSGFVTCCRRAGAPTSRWPSFVNATTDGVVRPPSAFATTVGSPPSRTAMHEFVVPRSIPIDFAIAPGLLLCLQLLPERKSESEDIRSSSAGRPDHGAAGDDEHGAERQSPPHSLRVADQEHRETDPPERLGGDERGDDADPPAPVRLEEEDVGEPEAE